MNQIAQTDDLRGVRILIVEDEYYLADDLAGALKQRGADVVGPVGTVEEASRLVDGDGFDCAILDMNLRGDMAFPVADRLTDAGIPFVIATGYNSASLPDRFMGLPRVEKPYDPQDVASIVRTLSNKD